VQPESGPTKSKADSSSSHPILALALEWANTGRSLVSTNPGEAIFCCDRALELYRELADAWISKGDALVCLGKVPEAISSYDRAIEIDPERAEAWFNRGNAFRALGRAQEAEWGRRLGEALGDWSLRPTGPVLEAIRCFRRALDIRPTLTVAWLNLGNAQLALGERENAIAAYERALVVDPLCVEAWFNKGNALAVAGDLTAALVCFERALEIDPQFAPGWFDKALTLTSLGLPGALESYQRFLACAKPEHEPYVQQALKRMKELAQRSSDPQRSGG
jgi:superkiller protein 3